MSRSCDYYNENKVIQLFLLDFYCATSMPNYHCRLDARQYQTVSTAAKGFQYGRAHAPTEKSVVICEYIPQMDEHVLSLLQNFIVLPVRDSLNFLVRFK